MDFNVFLDEEKRNKYYILKLLELRKSSFISQGQLIEILGMSKYKIDKFLQEICDDANLLNLEINIFIDPYGGIKTEGIDNLVTKKIRLYYLENSIQYKILMEIFAENYQMVDLIAKNLYVSRTSIYKELKILKTNLKVFDLKIRNLKICGKELKVRSFFFFI